MPVLHDQEIRRALKAEKRRCEAEKKTGGRDQECEPEGRGGMRHAQKRRNETLEPAEKPRAAPAGDEEHDHGERERRRKEPGRKAEERRAAKPRHREERAERRERELLAAERRKIAESRKRNSEKAGRHGHDQESERGQGKEPQQGGLLVHAVAARPFVLDHLHPGGMRLRKRRPELLRAKRRRTEVERGEARAIFRRQACRRQAPSGRPRLSGPACAPAPPATSGNSRAPSRRPTRWR